MPEREPNIYLERSGIGIKTAVETLLQPPEHPLSDEQMTEVLAFEAELCELTLDESGMTLEKLIRQRKSEAPSFYVDAFIDGHITLDGMEGQLRQLHSADDVQSWLASHARDKSMTPETFRELQAQSAEYYKAEVTTALINGKTPPASTFERRSVAIEPDKAILYGEADRVAREKLLELSNLYDKADEGVDGAKRALVEVYLKKINSAAMADIKSLHILAMQSNLINDTDTMAAAYELIPPSLRRATAFDDTRPGLYKRIDYLQNGIGYTEDGKASSVAHEVITGSTEREATGEALYTADQKEQLQHFKLTPDQMNEAITEIVRRASLLSKEDPSTWQPKRGKRAEDELFQVVISPQKASMSVNGVDGVVLTPRSPRSLYDLLVVTSHEMTHVDQAQYDREVGRHLKIGKLKGRRVSTYRETGANIVQRQFERQLFGTAKPVALAYAKALQAFEAGGSVFEATQAFYEEKRAEGPSVNAVEAAELAADRVLRLAAGNNSQPMAYAEENIINSELADADDTVRQRSMLLTSLDMDDQLRLHRYGLLPEVDAAMPDWTEIISDVLHPYIDQALTPQQQAKE